MRMIRWTLASLVALLLVATPAMAEFDIELDVAKTSAKEIKIEKPSPGRDFVTHAATYLRVIPTAGDPPRAYPVFIDTRNYLTCPDSDQQWKLNRVTRVHMDKPSGAMIFGFFFDRPSCDNPTFHLEAITGESGGPAGGA